MKTALKRNILVSSIISGLFSLLGACNTNSTTKKEIAALDLKRGALISCAPAGEQFGAAGFKISGTEANQQKFNLGLALLHSFEYDEAEKVFASIIDESPECSMAY